MNFKHSEPVKPRFRRFAAAVFAGAAAAAVLAGVWTAAWSALSNAALARAETWLADQAAGRTAGQTNAGSGAYAACPALVRTGFPFHIGFGCAQPSVTFASGAHWRGPHLELRAPLWRPRRWTAAWAGRHRISSAGNGGGNGDSGDAAFTAATLAAVLDTSEGAERLEIAVGGALAESGPARGWRLENAALNIAREGAETVRFDIRIGGAVTPEDITGGAQLGRRIEHIGVAGAVTGPVSVENRPPGAAQLAEWRDAGGVIEIEDISAAFGVLALKGGGTLALDALLQPQGAFSLRVSGYEETLKVLAQRGVMTPGEAAMAGFVLSALAKKPDGGGPPYVEAPLSIQNNQIAAGPLKIGTLPPIRWPE